MNRFAITLLVLGSVAAGVLLTVVVLRLFKKRTVEDSVLPAARRTQGAFVPVSSPRPLPDLHSISLEPVDEGLQAQAALVIEFNEGLSSTFELLRSSGQFRAATGPLADALASLLNNPRVMDTVLGKAGYYLVKASPKARFMTKDGVRVAQEFGKAGQAGSRAVVVGGVGVALAPELAAVALAATAQYILTVNVEQIGKVAEVVHHRQMAEALGTADQVLHLVRRLQAYDDPRDWPEVLIAPLATAHLELSRQTFAAARLRDLILHDDSDGELQPAGPSAGSRSSAFYELAAGYELYAAAAQAAAARLVHAQAHGDEVSTSEHESQLHHHIAQLSEHHRAINELTDRKSRRFKQSWGRSLSGLREAHAEVIALAEAHEYRFVLAIDGPQATMLALPAAPTNAQEQSTLSDTTGTSND